jgi:hypothetical protein
VAPVAALATATQVWQVLALSHDPAAQLAVQVVIPVVPTVFFVVVAAAHDPVAKRVVVADAQVYVTALAVVSAPVMVEQAVHVSVHVLRHAVDAHVFTTLKAAPSVGQVTVQDA